MIVYVKPSIISLQVMIEETKTIKTSKNNCYEKEYYDGYFLQKLNHEIAKVQNCTMPHIPRSLRNGVQLCRHASEDRVSLNLW